jgi:hypothetical protein
MSGDQNFSAGFECNCCGAGASGVVDLICDSGYVVLAFLCDDCQIAEVAQAGGYDNPARPRMEHEFLEVARSIGSRVDVVEEDGRRHFHRSDETYVGVEMIDALCAFAHERA